MKPRKALITSAAIAATLVTASTAMALNGGILDNGTNDGVGTLDPTSVIVSDSSPAVTVPGPITITTSNDPAVTTSGGSTVAGGSYEDDDDRYESNDDEYESDDDHDEYDDDHHDDDDHDEYEGYDSDD